MNQKVTIYTLAEELNVSASTVSRAFNPNSRISAEKRKIILETAEKYGYTQNKMASRLSQNTINIGILMHGRIVDYYAKMLDGIKAAHARFQNYKVSCHTSILSKEQFNIHTASEILDQYLEARYDGVILHGLYHREIIDKVNQLTDAGIKVVALHNDIPASNRLFVSTIDTDTTVHMVSQLFQIFLPENRRNILVFSGSMQSSIHQNIVFALSRCAPKYGLNLVQHYDTMDFPEIAEKLVAEAFKTHTSIHGIYITSANSVPILKYLEEHGLGDRIAVVASDVFPALSEYMRKGVVNASIFQDPFAQGYNAFETLYYSLAEDLSPAPCTMTVPQIILKSNLSLYENSL